MAARAAAAPMPNQYALARAHVSPAVVLAPPRCAPRAGVWVFALLRRERGG